MGEHINSVANPERGRPGRKHKGKRTVVTTRISDPVMRVIDAEAQARGLSRSEYVSIVVAQAHRFPADLPKPVDDAAPQLDLGIDADAVRSLDPEYRISA